MRAAGVGEPPTSCWLHPDVQFETSAVAGRGLFAAVDLPAETVVSRLGGRLVDTDELGRLFRESQDYVDTLVVAQDRHLVLAPGSANRFGNHGCDPNLGWADAYTLVTMRDVTAGTELLTDYAMATVDPEYVLRCHCESYWCRQMVAGDDWRIPQLQERYQGRWTPYVQQLVDSDQAAKSRRRS